MKKRLFALLLAAAALLTLLPATAGAVDIIMTPETRYCDYFFTTNDKKVHVRAYSAVEGVGRSQIGGKIIRTDTSEFFGAGGKRTFKAVPNPGYKFNGFVTRLYREAYDGYGEYYTANVNYDDTIQVFSDVENKAVSYYESTQKDAIRVNRAFLNMKQETQWHPLYLTVMAVFEPITYTITNAASAGVTLAGLPASAKYREYITFTATAAPGYDFNTMQLYNNGKRMTPISTVDRTNTYRFLVDGPIKITSAMEDKGYHVVYSPNSSERVREIAQKDQTVSITFSDPYRVFRRWVFMLPYGTVNPGEDSWKYKNSYYEAVFKDYAFIVTPSWETSPTIEFYVPSTEALPVHNALGGETLALWAEYDYKLKIFYGVFTDSSYDVSTAEYEKIYSIPGGVNTFIRANDPPRGYAFDKWVSTLASAEFGDVNSPNTTLKWSGSVEENVVYPTYKLRNLRSVTVSGGTHAGEYDSADNREPNQARAGELVTVTASPPAPDIVFKEWNASEGVVLEDRYAPETTFIMPDNDVSLTAVFELPTIRLGA